MHLVDALLAGDPIVGGVRGVGLPDHGGDGEGAEEEGEHGGRMMLGQGDQRHFYIVHLLCTPPSYQTLCCGSMGYNHVSRWTITWKCW